MKTLKRSEGEGGDGFNLPFTLAPVSVL